MWHFVGRNKLKINKVTKKEDCVLSSRDLLIFGTGKKWGVRICYVIYTTHLNWQKLLFKIKPFNKAENSKAYSKEIVKIGPY